MSQLASRTRDALVEAALAGALAGLFEGVRVGFVAGAGAGAWLVVAAVAAVGAIPLAIALRGVIAAVMRMPAIAGGTVCLRDGGRARTVAAFRIALGAVALLVVRDRDVPGQRVDAREVSLHRGRAGLARARGGAGGGGRDRRRTRRDRGSIGGAAPGRAARR
jgi:hypothetical protein